MKKITVVGSISMDLVTTTNRVPNSGETVFGEQFAMVPGGKGANQAVAMARLVPDLIEMIGAVGADSFGEEIRKNFTHNHVLIEHVGTVPQTTGIAQITLFDEDNRIIIIPGANDAVSSERFDSEWDVIADSALVVLQNEIPHQTNLAVAQYAKENGVKVLYNPAPARPTDMEMIEYVDYFTPNEHECSELFPDATLEETLTKYPNKLLVTLGVKGVTFHDGKAIQLIPAIKAKVADTTGAGDTWNGAFAIGITQGLSIKEATKFAILASHLSVQKFGAQGGMPTLSEMKGHEKYEKTWNIK
ncbi:ribokinase [Lactococcus fujiensis]|uniref:Ribokinase n=1 Tax=Lactococcus fujiensis JCM 16395 TaxID=1291764 RepID=A0A2A5RQ21_9LACT|nr:ribokinase [Lactococcus fujiensis]PCS01537.1 Ribokinase [Lactococcus fujiensis JCM 16395]